MTLEIKEGDASEGIPCPENTLLLGFQLNNKRNIANVNTDTSQISAAFRSQCTVMERQWEDTVLKLFFYTTDDPEYLAVNRRYAGLPMLQLHICHRDLEITATL